MFVVLASWHDVYATHGRHLFSLNEVLPRAFQHLFSLNKKNRAGSLAYGFLTETCKLPLRISKNISVKGRRQSKKSRGNALHKPRNAIYKMLVVDFNSILLIRFHYFQSYLFYSPLS